VAPVDALWLRRIAVMRDLGLASRTFPRHRYTGTIESQVWYRRGSLPSFAVRWHELYEGSSRDG
jgi:hypothetical protein